MKQIELLKKYQIKDDEWEDMPIVDLKIKAENIIHLFSLLENSMASIASPKEIKLIYDTQKKLLSYIDKLIKS